MRQDCDSKRLTDKSRLVRQREKHFQAVTRSESMTYKDRLDATSGAVEAAALERIKELEAERDRLREALTAQQIEKTCECKNCMVARQALGAQS
jgi:dTDP-4-amino-4,6-dideoxygalactose transaminase